MIYNHDMKNIEIDYKYDLIILPFNTFSYLYTLNDVSNFFKGIKRISGNSTIIMIDIFNPKIDDLKDTLKYKLCRKFVINNKICKLYEKHLYKKKYVIENNELVLNLPNRVFFPQEVLNLFQLNGFKVKEIIGDYNNEKFNSNSRKQIFFLEKRLDDENFKIFKVD